MAVSGVVTEPTMRTDIKIDFVAMPQAGHVFPQLQLAKYALSQGMTHLRFYSCPVMQATIESAGIEFQPILADKQQKVLDLAAHHEQIMDSFAELFTAMDRELESQEQFESELRNYWKTAPPDLVVVDFLAPFAGVVADELGIPWWTAITAPTAIETKTGTPSFFCGLTPPKTFLGRWRNALGRAFLRFLKKFAFFRLRKKLQPLGLTNLYREDGTERIYSNDVILGFGIEELEFADRILPKAWHWIGPCLDRPVLDHHAPHYESGKKHILVAPGTQVRWAKELAEAIVREVAKHMPECNFHFVLNVLNDPDLKEPRKEDNLHEYGYIPFTPESFRNYDVILNMGGNGIMYTAILAGVPQIMLPQSFEQHDCTARIAVKGLGLRSHGTPESIVSEINKLLENDQYHKQADKFRQITERYHPGRTFVELVQKKFS